MKKLGLLFSAFALGLSSLVAFSTPALADSTVKVYGDTTTVGGGPGWMFNRDTSTDTPFEFTTDEHSIGIGSLHVLPIGSTPSDKFIGEYFVLDEIVDVSSFSYDFMIAGTGDSSDASQFYLNVYTLNDSNYADYYDCRFDYVPATGSTTEFTTFSVDMTDPADDVTKRGGSGMSEECPVSPSLMPAGSHLSFFAMTLGDTSSSDEGIGGYFDNVNFTANGDTTTFDLDPVVRSAEITSPVAGSEQSGMVTFSAHLTDDDVDAIQWAVRQGTCAAGTNTVFGNVDGKSNDADMDTSDPMMQTFEFTADMSAMTLGMYCFIYNPTEDAGESGIRVTSEFQLVEEPVLVGPPTSKGECKRGGWMSFNSPEFKNQGDCVSHIASGGKAKGNPIVGFLSSLFR